MGKWDDPPMANLVEHTKEAAFVVTLESEFWERIDTYIYLIQRDPHPETSALTWAKEMTKQWP